MNLRRKLTLYYITAIVSVITACASFGYNAWRLEVTEDNNTVRTASFEVLSLLAEFEQSLYTAHYDQDEMDGNPRKAWVKVGLIHDLSVLISPDVSLKAESLKQVWALKWQKVPQSQAVTNELVEEVDQVRAEIKRRIMELQ